MIRLKSKFAKGLSMFLAVALMFTMLPGGLLKASAVDADSNTEIADMPAGTDIQFAGKTWTLLDPSTGLMLCDTAIGSGEYGATNEFKSGNAAYDSISAYYSSLSAQEQAFIQNHTWATLTNSVTCKIGLPEESAVIRYSETIKSLGQDWFLCTALGDSTDKIMYMKANGTGFSNSQYESVSSSAAYRPALYLYPHLKLAYEDTSKYCLIDVSTVNASGSGYTYSSNNITLTGGYTYVLYGSTTTNTVTVPSSIGTADVILAGVDIESSSDCAFSINSGASVNLTLNGKNTLKSGNRNAGLQVPDGAALIVTSSSTGSLEADGSSMKISGAAGIGGGDNSSGGTITINNGNVTATGGDRGAGIGGGSNVIGGTITVNGGNVTATGGNNGAGISGGNGGNGGTVVISGGTVNAKGGACSAGIGGGNGGNGGTVTISAGKVTVSGGDRSAGIGGGYYGDGGTTIISGGTVTASGSGGGAGIGGGDDGNGGTTIISGAGTSVTADGEGNDIGHGLNRYNGNLTVGDDKVTTGSLPTVNLKSEGTDVSTSFQNCVINNSASTEMTGTYNADGYIPVPVGLQLFPSFTDSSISLQASVGNASNVDTYDGKGTVTFSYSYDLNGGYTAVDGGAVGASAAEPATSVFTPASGKDYTVKAEYSSTHGYRKGDASTAISADATLSGLAVTSGELSPDFSSGTTDYTVNVGPDTGSIQLKPTANESHAAITVNGSAVTSGSASNDIALNDVGSDTTIPVIVTAQAGNTKTYTVKVHRAAEAVSKITVSPVNGVGSSVAVGDTLKLSAAVSPSDANQSVDWTVTTQNGGVSMPDYGNGTITENSDGTATFTGTKAGIIYVKASAKDGSGVYGFLTVHVTSNESVSISSPTGGSGFEGDILPLTATVTGGSASPTVTWAIDNDAGLAQPTGMSKGSGSITDNQSGIGIVMFNATTAGYVYVKATADGVSSQPYLIKIYAKNIAGTEKVSVSGSNSVATGGTLQLSASVAIDDSTLNVYQNVTWGSSDNSIATVDSSGKVTGVKAGKATITATAQDGSGVSGSADITVTEAGTAPAITTSSLPDGTAGMPYSQTLAAAGDMPVIWSVLSGSLPDGLSFDTKTGIISGTPTKAGNFTFTVKASNAFGADTKQLSIQIDASNPAPAKPTITIQESPVKSFLHFVTFGLFFGDTIHVSFSSSDSSNVDHYEYQTVASDNTYNAGDRWAKANSFSISPDFKGSVYARAVGKNGAYSDVTVEALVVDKTKPTISATYSEADDKINVSVTDNEAGIGTISYKVGNQTAQTINLEPTETKDITTSRSFDIGSLPNGKYDVVINAADNSGNAADTKTIQVAQGPIAENVSVTPSTTSVQQGGTQTFSAAVTGNNSPDQTVTWSVNGKNSTNTKIDGDGKLTVGADETAATLTVTATSTVDNTKYGTATVAVTTVTPPAPTVSKVTVTPSTTTVQKGGAQTFSAAVTGNNSPDQTVTWSVNGKNSTDTKIDGSGELTVGADETAATLTVTATSTVDNTKYGTATVTVEKTKTLTSIGIQTLPVKLNYVQGDTLDLTGATLTLKYSDNSSETIAVQSSMVSGFDSSKTGSQEIAITYGLRTTSLTVNVIPAIIDNANKTVTVNISGVSLPSGVSAVSLDSSTQDSGSSAYSVVEKLIGQNESLGTLSKLTVYDLKLLDQNGNPITNFTGKIKVKIPILSGMSGNLHVYWYNPADGTVTDMNATQDNGYLVFETTHFSYYAITQLTPSTDGISSSGNTGNSSSSGASGSAVPNPKTGSNNWPLIPLALLGGSSAAGFVVMKKRVKYRVKKR